LPLAILDQTQKASTALGVGMLSEYLLSEERIADIAHVDHKSVKHVIGQTITKFGH
jgi:hypothetical protein